MTQIRSHHCLGSNGRMEEGGGGGGAAGEHFMAGTEQCLQFAKGGLSNGQPESDSATQSPALL